MAADHATTTARRSRPTPWRPWQVALATIGIALLAAYLVALALFDPATTPGFPRCLILPLTGSPCPGCGIQRALHQLFNGNLAAAFAFHPAGTLLALSVPIATAWLAGQKIQRASSRSRVSIAKQRKSFG